MNKIKYNRMVRYLKYMVNAVSPYGYGLNTSEQRRKKIIVSFTSYPDRFRFIPAVFKSICRQSMKPDKVILYLCRSECDDYLPDSITNLIQYGLKIVMVKENFKPHNKYFYSMQEYPNDIIITIDDDILYPRNMIKELYASYIKYPNCISASRVHLIKKDSNGKIRGYKEWDWEYRECYVPSHMLIATGVGGVLYPPYSLPTETFNKECISTLCLKADDIWLKFMAVMNDMRVVYVPKANPWICSIRRAQKNGLYKTNVLARENDICINNVMKYYGISSDAITEDDLLYEKS